MAIHDLDRFIKAQQNDYVIALEEIKRGQKRSHWMWYIFPQLKALGRSEIAKYYGINDINEAAEYLAHPVLGKRLDEICVALLEQSVDDPYLIFGSPDDLKLQSCITLFNALPVTLPIFSQVLDKFYRGAQDQHTLALL